MTRIHDTLRTEHGVKSTTRSITGSSLFRPLPDAKHDLVKKYFGSSFATQRKDKYSSTHKFTVCGELVTLYMSCGEWRFGAGKNVRGNPFVIKQLDAIQKLLEGPQYEE